MKKAVSMILVFVMLLSLYACGKKDTQATEPTTAPTQAPAETKQEATIGETDATQASTQEMTEEPTVTPTDTLATNVGSTPTTKVTAAPTTAPATMPATEAATAATTDELTTNATTVPTNAPTTKVTAAPTTKATTAPTTKATTVPTTKATTAPTTKPATAPATMPATEAATVATTCSHNYIDGICSVCGGLQENYKALDNGVWTGTQVFNERLIKVKLSFKYLFFSAMYGDNIYDPDFDSSFRDQLLQEYEQNKNALTVADGVYYYTGSGDGGEITYTVNENTIQVNCDGWINLSITRTAGNQMTITKCDEIADLPGIILTWQEG